MIELNKIYNMDCVEGMKLLDDESVDLTVTSPPYDDLRVYNGYSWDYKETIKQLYRVTKQGGTVVWIVSDAYNDGSETGTSFRQALYAIECGFKLNDTMIWDKEKFTTIGNLNSRYPQTFEYMFVFTKGYPKTFNPIKDRQNKWAGEIIHGTRRGVGDKLERPNTLGNEISEYGIRFNVWKLNTTGGYCTEHPASFPEALISDHLISWSNEGDVVLDPFMGSGTTAVVAKRLGRKYIGFELSKDYYDLSKRRLIGSQKEVKQELEDGTVLAKSKLIDL